MNAKTAEARARGASIRPGQRNAVKPISGDHDDRETEQYIRWRDQHSDYARRVAMNDLHEETPLLLRIRIRDRLERDGVTATPRQIAAALAIDNMRLVWSALAELRETGEVERLEPEDGATEFRYRAAAVASVRRDVQYRPQTLFQAG